MQTGGRDRGIRSSALHISSARSLGCVGSCLGARVVRPGRRHRADARCAPLPRGPQHGPQRQRGRPADHEPVAPEGLGGVAGRGRDRDLVVPDVQTASAPVSGMPLSRKIRTFPFASVDEPFARRGSAAVPAARRPRRELHRTSPPGSHAVGSPSAPPAPVSRSGPYSSATARGECTARHAASASQSITSLSRTRIHPVSHPCRRASVGWVRRVGARSTGCRGRRLSEWTTRGIRSTRPPTRSGSNGARGARAAGACRRGGHRRRPALLRPR